MTWRRAAAVLGLVAAVVAVGLPPLLVLIDLLARWSVAVPAWEEWGLGGMLAALLDGRLGLADLWRPHNEHRPLVSRVLLLGLAWSSGWEVSWALAANVVVQTASYLLFALVAVGGARRTERVAMLPSVAACGWLLFSPVQWENWMWGWQLAIFAMVCACALAALGVARWRGGWLGAGAVWLAAGAAALSFASGLALVVALPLVLAVHPAAQGRRWRVATLSGALAGALLVAYVVDLPPGSSRRPPPIDPRAEWYLAGYYVLAYLGAPLGAGVASATAWGAAGLALLAVGWLALPRAERRAPAVLAWMLVAMVAVGSACLTATGRGGYGIHGALLSRYTSIGTLLWVSLAFLWNHLLALRLRTPLVPRTSVALAAVTAAVGALAVAGYRDTAAAGTARTIAHRLVLTEQRECARGLDRAPASCIERLFRDPDVVRAAVPLGARGIGPLRPRDAPSIARWQATSAPRPPGRLEVVDTQAAPGFVRVRGWAWNPFRRAPAREILLAVDGRVVQRVPIGLPRPDLRAQRRHLPLDVGFETRLASFRFPPGAHEVTAWLPHRGGTRVVRVPGAGRFVTEPGASLLPPAN